MLVEAGSSTNLNSLEMDDPMLDEVRLPSWLSLDMMEVSEKETQDFMEGAILGDAEDGALDGAVGGIGLDDALGFGTGTWAREGGSPSGNMYGEAEHINDNFADSTTPEWGRTEDARAML
jgi:hypothetical protein